LSNSCLKFSSDSRRTGRIPSDALPEGSLLVIEVDVPPDLSDLPQLPPDLPPIDGIVVCYDASNPTTFQPVETLLRTSSLRDLFFAPDNAIGGYRAVKLPVIVLACKADLERRIEPDRALETLQEYDVGLVEVTTAQDGKGKMRQSFDWLLKAVFRARRKRFPGHEGFAC
jgi:GTPase SAR1 family protein